MWLRIIGIDNIIHLFYFESYYQFRNFIECWLNHNRIKDWEIIL
jgi:hypothetical protein